jgi:hypothetical protein
VRPAERQQQRHGHQRGERVAAHPRIVTDSPPTTAGVVSLPPLGAGWERASIASA